MPQVCLTPHPLTTPNTVSDLGKRGSIGVVCCGHHFECLVCTFIWFNDLEIDPFSSCFTVLTEAPESTEPFFLLWVLSSHVAPEPET